MELAGWERLVDSLLQFNGVAFKGAIFFLMGVNSTQRQANSLSDGWVCAYFLYRLKSSVRMGTRWPTNAYRAGSIGKIRLRWSAASSF